MNLERVIGVVSLMIESQQELLDRMEEARPDWINRDDFRSGRWIERREGLRDKVRQLQYVAWWLGQLDQHAPSKD